MLVERTTSYAIYFGAAQDNLHPSYYLALEPNTTLLTQAPYAFLQQQLGLKTLYFLRQIHSVKGYRIESGLPPTFAQEGDYLITSTQRAGIGVMTADCLPVIIIDNNHKQLAVVHAGWRGSVENIIIKTLQDMAVSVDAATFYFGPSARPCCYEVDQSFAQNIPDHIHNKVLKTRQEKTFFDLPGFNQAILESIGIKDNQIIKAYNACTLCDSRFFSHRRQGPAAGRQMTVATLL